MRSLMKDVREPDLLPRLPSVAGLWGWSLVGDGDRLRLEAVDLERLLWNEMRELDVLGRGDGEEGGMSWGWGFGELFLIDGVRDVAGESPDDADGGVAGEEVEVEMLKAGGSVSRARRASG